VTLFKAPQPLIRNQFKSVFLAGSIDSGSAANWQQEVCNYFSNADINLYNPRRDDWNNTWIQKIENAEFKNQVNWELAAMQQADLIIMNFLPGSKSPVTMLELGLYAHSKKLIVCCPDEFYRSGNVHIICKNYHIPLFKNLNQLLQSIKN
jgi:nucleoside 2-deoxyribosyltransferase